MFAGDGSICCINTGDKSMGFNKGGIADKKGNEYEYGYFAKLSLGLLSEKIDYIKHEEINNNHADYVTYDKNGISYYQCKAQCGNGKYWTFSELASFGIFEYAAELKDNERFVLVSPYRYETLKELCYRARHLNEDDDIKIQLSSKELRELFNKIENRLKDRYRTIRCLRRIDIENFDYTDYKDLYRKMLRTYFIWNGDILDAVSHFTVNEDVFNLRITKHSLIESLSKQGIVYIDEVKASYQTIISSINATGKNRNLINDIMIPRDIDDVIEALNFGRSVVIHGEAGSGKSCIVRQLMDVVCNCLLLNIEFLLPENNPVEYGKKLGFENDPAISLYSATHDDCVVIFDQLDYLKWSDMKSKNAAAIIRSVVENAETLNKVSDKKIKFVFVTRTFDLYNNREIKSIVESTNCMYKCIDGLNELTVESIVGNVYNSYSPMMKKLLQVPSHLYVYTQLSDKKEYRTYDDMLDGWIKEINGVFNNKNLDLDILWKIASLIDKGGYAFDITFMEYAAEIDELCSIGFLKKEENGRIGFVHQSFMDYIVVFEQYKEICNGTNITSLIKEQSPAVKYRLLRLLERLLNCEDLFISQSKKLLEDENIYFYIRCTVFEALLKTGTLSNRLMEFVYDYSNRKEWSQFIQNGFYIRCSSVFPFLKAKGYFDVIGKEQLSLLKACEDSSFIYRCLIESDNKDKIYDLICGKYKCDNNEIIEYRKKTIIGKNPRELNYLEIMDMADNRSPVLAGILPYLIKNVEKIPFECYEPAIMYSYARFYYKEIIDYLSDLKQKCSYLTNDRNIFEEKARKWINCKNKYSLERTIVDMFAVSFEELARIEPDMFLDMCFSESSNCSVVVEIFSRGILSLDSKYANEAIKLMTYNDGYYLLSRSGHQDDYLYYSKQIIRKFSSLCNGEEFSVLEKYIYFSDKYASKNTLRHRTEHNRNTINNGYKEPIVYWSFWGLLQRELLPCLDKTRASVEAKGLLDVFKRNTYYGNNRFDCGFRSLDVESYKPFGNRYRNFSDNTWLSIIGTDESKYAYRNSKKLLLMNESRHEYFCSSFSECLNNQPLRYAKLSLKLPDNCYYGYISAVLRMIASKKEEIDNELVTEIVYRYLERSELSIRMAIMDVIKERPECEWNEQVLGFLKKELFSDEGTIRSEEDLLMILINSAQGYASLAVKALLNAECKLGSYFKSSISALLAQNSRISIAAAYFCVLPYHEFDESYYYETMLVILKEPDILLMSGSESVLYNLYNRDRGSCYKVLSEAIVNEDEEIVSKASYISTCINIQLKDPLFRFAGKESLEAIKDLLKNGICVKECSLLIEEMLSSDIYDSNEFESILYIDNVFDNHVDAIKNVVRLNKKAECSNIFLHRLSKKDGTVISKYVDILYELCSNDNAIDSRSDRRALDNLIICLSKLSEECQCDNDSEMINTVWNQLYIRTSICNDKLGKIYGSVKYDD